MTILQDSNADLECIAIVGMGYVGITLAVALAKAGFPVVGYDIDELKIANYASGFDPTGEVGSEELHRSSVLFTSSEDELDRASFFIIAVPTPVNADNQPDLQALKASSKTVGGHLRDGAVVVYESTVYPGVTEDICLPILEKSSGLTCGTNFGVGYSPERINPGDGGHKLQDIVKIYSATDDQTATRIENVYGRIIEAGLHRVSSIKTAEAVKLAENSQRDINIAFMNELAVALHHMGIDTSEVLTGMATKWNALEFSPGLVGGHCISVDPYYFAYAGKLYGYPSEIVSNARMANERMASFIAEEAIKAIEQDGSPVAGARIAILGATYKANCPDIRNSKAFDIARFLEQSGCSVFVVDPRADTSEVLKRHGIQLHDLCEITDVKCLIVPVYHDEFNALTGEDLVAFFDRSATKTLIDVTRRFDAALMNSYGIDVWQL